MSHTTSTIESAVHDAHEAYLESINSNDVARFLATVTDDIVFLPPNSEPIVGRDAVGAWVAGYFEAIQTVWTKATVELVVANGLAYEWYRYQVVDSPRDGGEAATDAGNGVNIYRLGADGTWRVWRDIWSTASSACSIGSEPIGRP
jgi:uncharacterized protein (TIGR02246 family)